RALPPVRTNPSMVRAMAWPALAMTTTTRLSFRKSVLALSTVGVATGSRALNVASQPPNNARVLELRSSSLTLYLPAATLIVSPEVATKAAFSTVWQGADGTRQLAWESLPCRETQRSAAKL